MADYAVVSSGGMGNGGNTNNVVEQSNTSSNLDLSINPNYV